jgi:hypothetical protein
VCCATPPQRSEPFLTESPKPPPRPAPRAAGASAKEGPPPPPVRGQPANPSGSAMIPAAPAATLPPSATPPERAGSGTAPLPGVGHAGPVELRSDRQQQVRSCSADADALRASPHAHARRSRGSDCNGDASPAGRRASAAARLAHGDAQPGRRRVEQHRSDRHSDARATIAAPGRRLAAGHCRNSKRQRCRDGCSGA